MPDAITDQERTDDEAILAMLAGDTGSADAVRAVYEADIAESGEPLDVVRKGYSVKWRVLCCYTPDYSISQVSERAGVSWHSTGKHLKSLGLAAAKNPGGHSADKKAAVQERRKKVADMAARGMSIKAMADALGVSTGPVTRDMAILGISRGRGWNKPLKSGAA